MYKLEESKQNKINNNNNNNNNIMLTNKQKIKREKDEKQ